ncbi:hypothetical protein [Lentzea roselyniae]|uniref:hypothetical protein n=1 Tax=Lentzea roselyniae TaxID=531940 RepID=UPI0031F95A49
MAHLGVADLAGNAHAAYGRLLRDVDRLRGFAWLQAANRLTLIASLAASRCGLLARARAGPVVQPCERA